MALSPALEDRELGKFRDAGSVTSSRVATKLEDVQGSNSFSTGAHTTPSVTNVSATVLAANSLRRYALFTNNGGAIIYLKLGAAAVVNQGIPLQPNERYEIGLNNLWTGSVTAIKSTATALALDVFEAT